jgi:chromosome segregation ATPase
VSSFVEAIEAIEQQSQRLSHATSDITDTKSTLKKTKKQAKVIQARLAQENAKITSRQRELEKLITSIRSEKHGLEAALRKAEAREEDLQVKMGLLITSTDDKVAEVTEAKDAELRGLSEQLETERSSFSKTLAQKEQSLATLSQTVAHHEKALDEAHESISSLKDIVNEKDEQLHLLALERDELAKAAQYRKDREIATITKDNESALEQMHARVQELQQLTFKYEGAIADAEAKNQALVKKVAKLETTIREMTTEKNSYRDGRSSEQTTAEARLQAIALNAATARQVELENQRAQYEEEQRRLAAFVANAFPQWVNLRKELNLDAVRATIKQASRELARYEKNDAEIRRLLGISKSESCESALSRRLQELGL